MVSLSPHPTNPSSRHITFYFLGSPEKAAKSSRLGAPLLTQALSRSAGPFPQCSLLLLLKGATSHEFPSLYFAKIENSAICDTAGWRGDVNRGEGQHPDPPEKKGSQWESYLATKYKLGIEGRREGSQGPWAPPPKTPTGRGQFQGVNKS